MFSLDEHYKQYNKQLYRLIYFLTFDEQLAEDLLQETFISAYKAQHTYRGDSNVLAWLRTIAKNTVIDHFRSKKKYFWQSVESITDEMATSPSPEQLAKINEQTRELYEGLAQLKFEYRIAVVLRKIEGLSISQTAQILNWSENKVKNNTVRGMRQLEAILKGGEIDGKGTFTAENS